MKLLCAMLNPALSCDVTLKRIMKEDSISFSLKVSQIISSYPDSSCQLADSRACRHSHPGRCCPAGRCAVNLGMAGRCSDLPVFPLACRCLVDMLLKRKMQF